MLEQPRTHGTPTADHSLSTNSLSTLETLVAHFGDKLSPKTATVGEFGDSRRNRRP